VYVGKGGGGTAAGFDPLAAGGGGAPPGTSFMGAAERRRRERALQRGGWRAVPAPFPACPARWPNGRPPPWSACGSRATPATASDCISVAAGCGVGSTIPPAAVLASAAASAANIGAGAGDGATSDQGGGRVSYGSGGDVFVSAGGVVLCGSGRAGGVPVLGAPADSATDGAPTEAAVDAARVNDGGGGNEDKKFIVCGGRSMGGKPAGMGWRWGAAPTGAPCTAG